MKRLMLSALTLTLLGTVAVPAQADPMDDLMAKVYLKLTSIFSGPAPDKKVLVCLSNPGVVIPKKGFNVKKPEDVATLNNLFDFVPMPSPIYTPSVFQYSKVYGRIIRDHQTKEIPLSPEDTKKLADAQALVDEDTSPKMQKYVECRDKYYDALAAKNDAEFESNQPNGRPVSALIINKCSDALTKWKASGYKDTIEDAFHLINQLANRSGGGFWTEVTRRYEAAMDSTLPFVSTFPAPNAWLEGGWTNFTFSSKEKVDSTKCSETDAAASAKISAGGFHGSGSAAWSKAKNSSASSNTETTISFKLKRFYIWRTKWLDANVLSNTRWTLPGNIISNGADSALQASGDMGLMMNQGILIKDINISGSWVRENRESIEKSLKTEASMSYGPVELGGNYNSKDKSDDTSISSDGLTIVCKRPQLAGYICVITPKAPSYHP